MRIAVMTFRLRAEWVHSLKEKRMIVKSLIAKLQNKYHLAEAARKNLKYVYTGNC